MRTPRGAKSWRMPAAAVCAGLFLLDVSAWGQPQPEIGRAVLSVGAVGGAFDSWGSVTLRRSGAGLIYAPTLLPPRGEAHGAGGPGRSAALSGNAELSPAAPIGPAAADPVFTFRELYAFPNPARRGDRPTIRLQAGVADSVTVNVYDVAGTLVHRATFPEPKILDDGNGGGQQFTYDYLWDTGGVGSGIYRYAVTARKAGQNDIRKIGKVGIIK